MKKTLTLLLLAAMLTAPLAGCGDTTGTPTETTEGADNGTTNGTTADPNGTTASTTAGTDDNVPEYNAADANPASDFEYEVNDDGGITITKYIGADTDVVIPEKIDGKDVTVIGSYAFGRTNIVTVELPDTVTLLGTGAFEECESLTTVRLSRQLKEIGVNAFQNCTSLSFIDLPSSLITIRACAFKYCTSLKQIKIPKSVSEYGYEIFALSGIESVELEDGLKSLGESMFIGCKLKEVSVPNSITILPLSVFSGNVDLESITLHEGLKEISSDAFGYNDKLTEIVIPASVETVYESFVEVCASIQSVKFQGNAPTFVNEEFYQKENLNYTVYYHEGATGFTTPEWNGYPAKTW